MRPIWSRDLNFNGTIVGNVHAQPLYIEGGPNGPMIIAVTASNNVYALNATTGTVIWQRNIGTAASTGPSLRQYLVQLASSAHLLSISPPDHFSLTR